MEKHRPGRSMAALAVSASLALACTQGQNPGAPGGNEPVATLAEALSGNDVAIAQHATQVLEDGRHTFRFDTFGDEDFWGGALKLHQAIEGAALGGAGPGVSPKTALSVGLKIDIGALPHAIRKLLKEGKIDLDDPATTVALIKLNAVIGITGFFSDDDDDPGMKSMGIQCALCHSTVDSSFSAPGIPAGAIGHRLDGWANRDLNVGAIVALAPTLKPVADLLGVTEADVRKVLGAWGPGKFDAELLLDGRGFRPGGETAAVLIPPAFGLAGVNLHTWTGWGSVTHWNAFVATIEMHGKGRFFDPRLNNAAKFPIAARAGFADIKIDPDEDQVTSKLPALQVYQLDIPAPRPPEGSFDKDAAARGDKLFSGKAACNRCHSEPLWTEPGWNLHTPAEICVDDFQAKRGSEDRYRTSPLAGVWTHQKGGFFHDGRFATLLSVVNHYDNCFKLGLTAGEKRDVVEYVKSL